MAAGHVAKGGGVTEGVTLPRRWRSSTRGAGGGEESGRRVGLADLAEHVAVGGGVAEGRHGGVADSSQ